MNNIKKLSTAGVLCAVAVAGSLISFPVFGSKCAPVQHMVNIFCAVLLGPGYGVMAAFVASLIRNLLGMGSLMAFPGSMFGALICGIVYKKTHNIIATMIGDTWWFMCISGCNIPYGKKCRRNSILCVYNSIFYINCHGCGHIWNNSIQHKKGRLVS